MKQTQIKLPAQRGEQQIIDDIANESEIMLSAQQGVAALEAQRSEMLTSGADVEEIQQIGDKLARSKLKAEISQARIDALDGELRRFRATAFRARVEAAMAPLSAIDAEERETVQAYEQHAKLIAEDLARLHALQTRRHAVSVRVHEINRQWIQPESPNYHGALFQRVKLPSSAEGGADHWPVSPQVAMLEAQARAARDAQALREYRASEC